MRIGPLHFPSIGCGRNVSFLWSSPAEIVSLANTVERVFLHHQSARRTLPTTDVSAPAATGSGNKQAHQPKARAPSKVCPSNTARRSLLCPASSALRAPIGRPAAKAKRNKTKDARTEYKMRGSGSGGGGGGGSTLIVSISRLVVYKTIPLSPVIKH